MCMVSMIYDQARTIPRENWDVNKYKKLAETIEKTRELDKILDLPECDDSKKKQFMKELGDYLEKRFDLKKKK